MTALRCGAASDVGLVRADNQDDYLADDALFAVADGMGGAAGGEIASRTAVAALKATFDADPTANGLAEGVRNANRAVWDKAQERRDLRGMGTTVTAVALVEDGDEDVLAVVNVGDSRVYLLRDGVLDQLTDDHSVPEELLRAGRLTPAEAARHPQRNVLTRVLGVDEDVEVDCFRVNPYKGDRLVLASDGLYNEVDHEDIASVVRREADPQAAAHELVERARAGGGTDNITVVVVDVVDDDDRAGRASAAVGAATPSRTAAAGGGGRSSERDEVRASPPGGPGVAAGAHFRTPPPPATRRDERKDDGPRFTLRVAVFSLALVLVLAGAVAAVIFFARGGYFVGADGNEVVIYKGRPGGLLWLDPTVVERTGVSLSELRPARAQDVREGKEQASVTDAFRYVENIEAEATTTTTTTITTTTTPPVGPAPGAPVPPTPSR